MTQPGDAGLAALRGADLDWSTRLDDVWLPPRHDVPGAHAEIRTEFADRLATMFPEAGRPTPRSPLGWVLVGSGGVGKTHLLGALRRHAATRGAPFVLIDMTDVRDFWDTVLQGYLDSLNNRHGDDRIQLHRLLDCLLGWLGYEDSQAAQRGYARMPAEQLGSNVQQLLRVMRAKDPHLAHRHQDLVRAMFYQNSEDLDLRDAGIAWIRGMDATASSLPYADPAASAKQIVESLSWLTSLAGPCIVAFDQLDPIVQQAGRTATSDDAEERGSVDDIVDQIGVGLGAMRDCTSNTLSIVSCVESTWSLLQRMTLRTALDRFEPPRILARPRTPDLPVALVQGRLAPAYARAGYTPAYPTYPFPNAVLRAMAHDSFREILQRCDAHRRRCHAAGHLSELSLDATPDDDEVPAPSAELDALDAIWQTLCADADPTPLLHDTQGDEALAPLCEFALHTLVIETQATRPDTVDALVDPGSAGGATTPPLHGRLRLVFRHDGDREEHHCVRGIQRGNARAFNNRIKAAMTQSGIDRTLRFRHLTVIRSTPVPNGPTAKKVAAGFLAAGGRFYTPTDDDLRTLLALAAIRKQDPPRLEDWLMSRQPLGRSGIGRALAPQSLRAADTPTPQAVVPPPTAVAPPPAATSDDGSAPATAPATAIAPPPATDADDESAPAPAPAPAPASAAPATATAPATAHEAPSILVIGQRVLGAAPTAALVGIPIPLLKRHTLILGGAGSGKSVTVRRIVEEAALAGIPSLIIDCAQDMATFDQGWPGPQAHWRDGDAERAAAFHAGTEMVVWTPGRPSGNPLILEPLPDFAPFRDDAEGLADAVAMTSASLGGIVAPGSGASATRKLGILGSSLRYFASYVPDGTLDAFIDLLSDLPPEAGLGVKGEARLARDMADNLRVEVARNPLLGTPGTALDPAILFGDDDASPDKVRISVVSLVGLADLEVQRSFVNQLSLLLFPWLKAHPHPPKGRALRGLMVIDEARDFAPSVKASVCKESLMRLAAQGRKYGLGMVFATQHPKDIETRIVGNCATHLYGLNNSPASLATLGELMAQKGGSGDAIPRLKTGQFFVHNANAGHPQPIKTQIPMSLSVSPATPLDAETILAKAAATRVRSGAKAATPKAATG